MYVCTWNHCSADYCQNFLVLYLFTVKSLCFADTVSLTKFKCVGQCACEILLCNVLSALLPSCTVYISDHIRSWSERPELPVRVNQMERKVSFVHEN